MLVQQSTTARRACFSSASKRSGVPSAVSRAASRSRRSAVVTRAGMDTNFFLNLVTSTACGGMAAAVTLVTAEDTDKEVRVFGFVWVCNRVDESRVGVRGGGGGGGCLCVRGRRVVLVGTGGMLDG